MRRYETVIVEMIKAGRLNYRDLAANEKVEVPDAIGALWIEKGIARRTRRTGEVNGGDTGEKKTRGSRKKKAAAGDTGGEAEGSPDAGEGTGED